MDEAVATIKKVVSAMRFKCIEDTGYEGRLTAGKVYKNLPTPFPDEGFIVVRFDDDTQGEVYKERFEFVNFRAMAEEGVRCDCGSGTWVYPDTVEGCTCHLGHPPCGQCTSQQLYCRGSLWQAVQQHAALSTLELAWVRAQRPPPALRSNRSQSHAE